jgi:protein involved in polysaccharide export with SLBB domain
MRLSDAIRLAGGPKPDVYLDQILVSRLRPDSTRVQLRSAFADTTGAVVDDIVLAEEDEITVFSRTAFRPARYVVVSGAVRSPGRITYREGMTVRDAILLADGLTEDAYLREAEVARVPAPPAPLPPRSGSRSTRPISSPAATRASMRARRASPRRPPARPRWRCSPTTTSSSCASRSGNCRAR